MTKLTIMSVKRNIAIKNIPYVKLYTGGIQDLPIKLVCLLAGECKSISKLEDSTNIKLKVDMMGDNMSQITKLFQQSINDDPKDCPFYLRINLRVSIISICFLF